MYYTWLIVVVGYVVYRVNDFIDLRTSLGNRLDFLDKFYGEYSLATILEYPGEGRVNFVPIVSHPSASEEEGGEESKRITSRVSIEKTTCV